AKADDSPLGVHASAGRGVDGATEGVAPGAGGACVVVGDSETAWPFALPVQPETRAQTRTIDIAAAANRACPPDRQVAPASTPMSTPSARSSLRDERPEA